MTFADHFSGRARQYARFRPSYPAALIDFLAASSPGRDRAWDCGTGSGQAAVALAARFASVVATDPSAGQLAQAPPHPRVTYRASRESQSGEPEASVDCVTAAQAAHWFDLPAFYAEADRVLKPSGLLAMWCYGLLRIDGDIDPVLLWFYEDRVGRYWPPERRSVEEGYRGLPFPYERLAAPPLTMEASFDRRDLVGFCDTWSAVARCRDQEGADPMIEFLGRLVRVWPEESARRPVRWDLAVVAGRKAGR
jgi:SAM-dependent methyltransferase